MKLAGFALLAGVLVLGGCAHSTMRGSVAMKVSDREAHVCLGDNEAKVGNRVVAYTNVCPRTGGKEMGSSVCEKKQLGSGTVTQLLNEHYSLVKFDEDVKFDEGTFVEIR